MTLDLWTRKSVDVANKIVEIDVTESCYATTAAAATAMQSNWFYSQQQQAEFNCILQKHNLIGSIAVTDNMSGRYLLQ